VSFVILFTANYLYTVYFLAFYQELVSSWFRKVSESVF